MPIIERAVRRRKEREKRKIELKIEAEDFGPISGGKIALKPLTLFIGPNNSGKSYAAMLIHSIFESYTPSALTRGAPFFMRPYLGRGTFHYGVDIDTRTFPKEFRELRRQIDDLKEGEELEIPKQLLEKETNRIFEDVYERRLSDEIVRSFASPLKDLIRIG